MDTTRKDAGHTLVISDLHLTETEEVDPRRPLWMRHKHREHHIDGCVARFLAHQRETLPGEVELILNGDVFDFDAVRAIPEDPPFPVSFLERRRGLAPEEDKSLFRIRVILEDHPVFLQALREWVLAGHRVVFVIGNHDVEMHWPSVQEAIRDALWLPPDRQEAVRFCEWFYISGGDTLVEHGSQYDPYCVCPDPLHPYIVIRGRVRVRVPFGDIAGKVMLNGMGLFNPYVESSFIKTLPEYAVFFFKHVIRVQPLLGWSWLWSAVATLVVSLSEGFRSPLRDPIRLEDREREAAGRANATPALLRALRELAAHPAVFRPWKVLRELWLDRALLLGLLVFASFELVGLLNILGEVPLWWAFALFAALVPPFAFYARSVNSDVTHMLRLIRTRLPVAMRIAGVHRAVIGHTHLESHTRSEPDADTPATETLNTGTWSPAYEDVEYTRPFGHKCFAWIRPGPEGDRIAALYEWTDPGTRLIPQEPVPAPRWRWSALSRRLYGPPSPTGGPDKDEGSGTPRAEGNPGP